MSILAAFMVPHPPMIVPQVGRGSEAQVRATSRAYEEVAAQIAALKPETIVISSPHSIMYSDYFHISPGRGASGSFRNFGVPEVSFRETYDTELVKEMCRLAEQEGLPAGTLGERDKDLDHGTMVPLWFIRQKYADFRLVRLGLSGLPLTDHYALGQVIARASEETGRRVVFIGSGDLSHKLQDYGPYGFAPEGPEYDARIMDVCGRGAFGELFDFDETFCDRAAECGHRSFVILAGTLDGRAVEAKQLSHEDVTGVGYGICTFYPGAADASRCFLDLRLKAEAAAAEERRRAEDPMVSLARRSLEQYVGQRKMLRCTDALLKEVTGYGAGTSASRDAAAGDIFRELKESRAGAFVSIHEHGRLRGCIGTILPTADCLAEEIIRNAVSAAVRDPRFDPIRPAELPYLEINVDVLTAPEPVNSAMDLDAKRYGVIVRRDRRQGLLLPDLEGVDTVEQQIAIARQKAGIGPREEVQLERFEVIRHK